ncbi:hypothetical protein TNCV_4520631 [Trichonephila clavipes]|nr:hypothetical protein TNCV_4520631 [Trichonephila clavipes]
MSCGRIRLLFPRDNLDEGWRGQRPRPPDVCGQGGVEEVAGLPFQVNSSEKLSGLPSSCKLLFCWGSVRKEFADRQFVIPFRDLDPFKGVSGRILCKKVNGAMKTSSVDFISRSPTRSPMKTKHRRPCLFRLFLYVSDSPLVSMKGRTAADSVQSVNHTTPVVGLRLEHPTGDSTNKLGKISRRDDRWRHHLSPPPQFRHGTGGEDPVPCTRDSAHKIFGPTDLTSTYSVCTRRVFGGIGHRTQAFRQSEPRLGHH